MTVDKQNYIGFLEGFAKQCREALLLGKEIVISKNPDKIVVCGMGGSAIGGRILNSYLNSRGLISTLVSDYSLPEFVDSSTLVFLISYSGNTEETLSCMADAKGRGAEIVAITSGERLSQGCENVIEIPSGMQPRAAIGYLFFPMLNVLHNCGIITLTNKEVNEMLLLLKDTSYVSDYADSIAKKIGSKIPIFYSSSMLSAAAYRCKTQVNENAKRPSFCHVIPEMNHNEINSVMNMERRIFAAVFIRDSDDDPRILKRIDVSKDIIEKYVDTYYLDVKGQSLLARIFYVIFVGDYLSYYLAIRARIDPTPVDVIEDFKKQLSS